MSIEIVHGFVDYVAGDIVKVETVAPGVPKDIYWRRRLRDAVKDGCVKLPKTASKKRKSVSVEVTDKGIE